MGLPTDNTARKMLPIWDGVILYFPDVWAALAEVSVAGNTQHNAGEKLHWARDKSVDQMNTAFRHLLDYAAGQRLDTDGTLHLAKAIWRLCAECQVDIEHEAIGQNVKQYATGIASLPYVTPAATTISIGRRVTEAPVADLDQEIPF